MSQLLSSCVLAIFSALSLCAAPTPVTLVVAAASDLSQVGPQLQKVFEAGHPNVSIRLANGASGVLRQQIESGAPFDVFLSANAAYIDQLAERHRVIADSVETYALGRVGVAWRDGRKHPLRDLTTPLMQVVALPNPKLAPYGVAAQQALEYGGLWEQVQRKVIYGENVRQTLQYLESGNADAVLTSGALLQDRPEAEIIPADWHQPIVQKAAVVTGTRQEPAARAFLKFLLAAEGQAIFARYGFGAPNVAGKSPQSR